jgi:hypothetical protein
MYFVILLLSFIALKHAGPTCETAHGFVKCPTNFKCVPHVGCVPNDSGCRCAAEPCPWPQQCDCKGGCKARTCNPIIGCSNKTNPTNACETMACQSGKCVLAQRECANCNPVTGCPGTKQEEESHATTWNDHHRQQLTRDVPTTPVTTSNGGWSGLVIAMVVIIAVVVLLLLGMLIYVGSTARGY